MRELKHAVERLAVVAEDDNVSFKDLPENLTSTTGAAANVLIQLLDDGIDLEEVEREILRQALEKRGGNQTRTAQYLNITRSALIYRMQKWLATTGNAQHRQSIAGQKYVIRSILPNHFNFRPTKSLLSSPHGRWLS